MKRLLWIDDDEGLLDASVPVFLRNGFYIVRASNTARALTVLREESLDGVLLDVRLRGDESGLELLEDIRRRHPKLPVAVFTAFPEYDEHVVAERIGADSYIEKVEKSIPFDPDKQRRFFEALHRIFSDTPSKPLPGASAAQVTPGPHGRALTFLLFLSVFIVVAATVWAISRSLPGYAVPMVLVASIVLYTVVGGFILRADKGLSEASFLRLMLATIHLVPLLLNAGHPLAGSEQGGRPPNAP